MINLCHTLVTLCDYTPLHDYYIAAYLSRDLCVTQTIQNHSSLINPITNLWRDSTYKVFIWAFSLS